MPASDSTARSIQSRITASRVAVSALGGCQATCRLPVDGKQALAMRAIYIA
jgi:hypothetical protein